MISNFGGFGLMPGFQQTYELSAPGVAEVVTNSTQGAVSVKGHSNTANVFEGLDTNDNITSYVQANGDAHYENLIANTALLTDTILEKTVGSGVNIDSVLCKDGIVTITDPTDSSSTITGSIITAGGLGVAKKINAGAIIVPASKMTIGTYTPSDTQMSILCGLNQVLASTSSPTFTQVNTNNILGGPALDLKANGPVYMKYNSTILGTWNINGSLNMNSSLASTSASTGTIQVPNGGIGCNHLVSNSVLVPLVSGSASASGNLTLQSTTDASKGKIVTIGSIEPSATSTYTLGSTTKTFANIYADTFTTPSITTANLTTGIVSGIDEDNLLMQLGQPLSLLNNSFRVVTHDNTTLMNVSTENGGNATIGGNLIVTKELYPLRCTPSSPIYAYLNSAITEDLFYNGAMFIVIPNLEFTATVAGKYELYYSGSCYVWQNYTYIEATLNGTSDTMLIPGTRRIINVVGAHSVSAMAVVDLAVNDVVRVMFASSAPQTQSFMSYAPHAVSDPDYQFQMYLKQIGV